MAANTADEIRLSWVGAVATSTIPATTAIGNITACSQPRILGLVSTLEAESVLTIPIPYLGATSGYRWSWRPIYPRF